ncbi:hypothetical protein L1987_21291 [Smallanthus sonchifolius]|uniref:Uncharacterized protein n=1 Tax=Smallanthus sonchifolius TaxID=185202 RepID=A0ACB9IUQ2_9ASTR|nr:hypothetical protein L1987_21291 [Smallanthus sonchifolius]
MEPEPPPTEISDDQQQQTTTHTIKSYECNFCKRGFTNAQALGGHMNIHRKDKNKSKHSTTTPPNPLAEPPSSAGSQLSPTTITTAAANPFSISHQGNLFSATPQDEKKPLPLFDQHDTTVPRYIRQPGNPPLPDGEVDLELRLGHLEPQQESSSENKTTNTTTRNFF